MTNTWLIVSTLGLALAACGDNLRAVPDGPPVAPRAVVVAGDFNPGDPGVLTTLDPVTRTVQVNAGPAMAVGSDPILRHAGNELLIVNRGENNITILDDQTLGFKEQIGVGENTNPQDVAVFGNKLYVATFQGKGLSLLTRGSTTATPIELPADDPDGEPNCNSIFVVDRTLYVSCELFDDNFSPRGPGRVYIVDAATGAVKPDLTVTLARQNPFGLFEQIPAGAPHAGDLLISAVGDFTPASGCIERVATRPAPADAGCVLEYAAVGGYATRVAFDVAPGVAMMWAAVATPAPPPIYARGDLRGYDLMLGSLWDAPISPSSQAVADVAQCPTGEVVVLDATMNANGFRVYENGVEKTTEPMPIGLGSFSAHGLVCY